MPLERTRADLLVAGTRVLIVGDCGPGGWGTWVHERGPRWDERSLGDGYAAFPDCIAEEREPLAYDATWIRVYEDATWLSAIVDDRYRPQTADDVGNMVRCGVDMVGFDRLDPDDGRLGALVWSWAPDEPAIDPTKACVAWGDDARFRAAACGETRGYACRDAGDTWVVPEAVGPASAAEAACATVDAAPSTPPTGWDNERLRTAAAGRGELWLSIVNPLTPDPGASVPPSGGAVAGSGAPASAAAELPATGGRAPGGAALLVLASLVSLALLSRGWAGLRSPTPPP
jgi:hypothetical protein